MDAGVARFVSELRVALVRQQIRTFGGGWCLDPPRASDAWEQALATSRYLMRLGFGEAECAAAIQSTGASAQTLWPDDTVERAALKLMLVHIDEDLSSRKISEGEQHVVLSFVDGTAHVREEPGRSR